jgi:hypothetical protein
VECKHANIVSSLLTKEKEGELYLRMVHTCQSCEKEVSDEHFQMLMKKGHVLP